MFDFLRKGAANVLMKNDATVEEMLDQEELASDLSSPSLNGKISTFVNHHARELMSIATKVITEQQITANKKFATTYPKNATFLLSKYVSHEPDEAIPLVVPTMLRAFKVRGLVHSVVAKNVSEVCIAAFTNDFEKTTEAVDECLSDAELLHCIIRQLAASSHVASLVLNLLGNAIGPDSISLPAPNLFSNPWIKNHGHLHLVNYVKVAMASETMLPFFAFMSDLFQHGLAPHIGTLVDHVLDVSDCLITSIVEAVEECSTCPTSFPLLSEGLKLLVNMVILLQKASLSQSTEEDDYHLPLKSCLALRHLMKQLPRLMVMLNSDALAMRPNSLGIVRLRIIEVCMALHRCNRKDSDDCLMATQFYEGALRLAETYPTSDMLLTHVREILNDAIARTFDHGRLLRALEEVHIFARFQAWGTDERWKGTTLRALAFSQSREYSDHFMDAPHEFKHLEEAEAWNQFLNDELEVNCGRWFAPITGERYAEVGSGSTAVPAVNHRPVVNVTHAAATSSNSVNWSDNSSPTLDPVGSRSSRYSSAFDAHDDEDDDMVLQDGPAEWGNQDDEDDGQQQQQQQFHNFTGDDDELVPTSPGLATASAAGIHLPPSDDQQQAQQRQHSEEPLPSSSSPVTANVEPSSYLQAATGRHHRRTASSGGEDEFAALYGNEQQNGSAAPSSGEEQSYNNTSNTVAAIEGWSEGGADPFADAPPPPPPPEEEDDQPSSPSPPAPLPEDHFPSTHQSARYGHDGADEEDDIPPYQEDANPSPKSNSEPPPPPPEDEDENW